MNLIKTLLGKPASNDAFRMSKQPTGDWVVKKGSTVLYIGTKDKCETYLSYAV